MFTLRFALDLGLLMRSDPVHPPFSKKPTKLATGRHCRAASAETQKVNFVELVHIARSEIISDIVVCSVDAVLILF